MLPVIVESPYAGDTEEEIKRNTTYAQLCLNDCLHRGESPFASHLLYTQPNVLRDEIKEERSLGIEAGLVWGNFAKLTAIYTDLGQTDGMCIGIKRAIKEKRKIVFRELPKNLKNIFNGLYPNERI